MSINLASFISISLSLVKFDKMPLKRPSNVFQVESKRTCHARKMFVRTRSLVGTGMLASTSKEFVDALMKVEDIGVDHGKDDLRVLVFREATSELVELWHG